MEYSISEHDYRLKELETMMNFDGPHNDDLSHQPILYSQSYGWDEKEAFNGNGPLESRQTYNFSSSTMDTFPDTSFSALDNSSVLSSKHAPLPAVGLGASSNDPARLR